VLIRTGSCGSLSRDVPLRGIVVSEYAATDVHSGGAQFSAFETAAHCSPDLLRIAREEAERIGEAMYSGRTGASDHFYHPMGMGRLSGLMADNAIAIDMETHALYALGERLGFKALSICTVVDSMVTHEEIETSERQGVFAPMVRLALEVARTASAGL
jgi:purine-nucleoside phosphorylase